MKPKRPICCDDRAVRLRRDACLSADQQHLMGHIQACPDCRIERQLMADFEQSAAAQPLDEQLIARAAAHALAPIKARRSTWQRWSVAATVVFLAGAASAAITLHVRRPEQPSVHDAVDPGKTRSLRRRHGSKAPNATVPIEIPAISPLDTPLAPPVAAVPPAPITPAVMAPSKTRTAGVPRLARASLPQPEPRVDRRERPETAASLFALALEQRDGGQVGQAIATLRALGQRFPDSNQARVALVSLGDLLLREGNVTDGLLAFELYLARAPSGTLAPEALAGKVRALDGLGRHDEANAVRREIARRFPHFPYAAPTGRP